MNGKTAVITGASSGIGLALAKLMVREGYTVYNLSRRDAGTEGVRHISTDVTSSESVKNAVEEILSREKKIDVLVSNAGYGISGAIENTAEEDALRQLDVNFYGLFRISKAVLPIMRKQRQGKIIAISSVAGAISIPFQTMYSVSKAAINSYVMALANEVRPFGIKVAAVLPGDARTNFTMAREKNETDDSEYRERLDKSVAGMEKDEQNGMAPEYVASRIYRVIRKKSPKPMTVVGVKYKVFTVLFKILPSRFANWVVGKLYA